ncbi:hypothetical protein SAY86_006241 [Trapa natans]|uniref:Cytokinin riboside 5'-monophosphate phosphoribohydrolase n=1 Tax=Trapa natans TaxID=22666 RepID=A0AAN7QXG7_TRANT|nr:hypothetical protein SAY86_006241 [Trapa natans]
MVKQTSRFRRVCVFCGSSSGNRPSYQLAALQLAKQLVRYIYICLFGFLYFFLWIIFACQVERNIDLVYGGGSIGLMGLISQAVFDGGRHVLGVIPKTLMPREVRLLLRLLLLLLFLLLFLLLLLLQITGETVGEVRAVSSMHQRKAEMAQQSDAFIALPGGYGTLEELLEVISWSQLGIHDKPVGLLNVDGYYNSLLSFIDKAVDEGFVTPSARHIFVSAPTAHELISKLEEYAPEHCGVASKLSWEMERQIDCDTMLEIGR